MIKQVRTKKSVALTISEREAIKNKLTKEQLDVLNQYKRYKYNSAFHQNNYLRHSDWQFYSFNEDDGYDRSKGNNNLLHCKCGKGLKYQFVVKSKRSGRLMELGISHFSQHLGIPIEVAEEVRRGFNRIDLGMDEVLRKVNQSQSFPYNKYELYQLMGLSDSSHKKLDKIFNMCAEVNLPLVRIDEERMDSLIAENKEEFNQSKEGKRKQLLDKSLYEIDTICFRMTNDEEALFHQFVLDQELNDPQDSLYETKEKLSSLKKIAEDFIRCRNLERIMRKTFDSLDLEYIAFDQLDLNSELNFFELYENYQSFAKFFEPIYKLERKKQKRIKLLEELGEEFVNEWNHICGYKAQKLAPKNIFRYGIFLEDEWLPMFKGYYTKQKKYLELWETFPVDQKSLANQRLKEAGFFAQSETYAEAIDKSKKRNRQIKSWINFFLSEGNYIETSNGIVMSPEYKKQVELERKKQRKKEAAKRRREKEREKTQKKKEEKKRKQRQNEQLREKIKERNLKEKQIREKQQKVAPARSNKNLNHLEPWQKELAKLKL